jgi:predicted lipoprotein with Yx(FWY)xxD motif
MKRTVIAAGTLVALTACAPAGYNGADAGEAAPIPVAAAEPTATGPETSASPDAPKDAPSDVELTDELIGKKVARMGEVVTDQDGWILYRFDKDTADPPASNCVDTCAEIWPPALTDGEPALDGVSDDKVGTIDRQDGTKQLTLGGWPLYRYIGDKKPGQWKGQGVSGTWFVVQPNGKKNLSCLPTGTPKPVAPPADDENDSTGGSDYSY